LRGLASNACGFWAIERLLVLMEPLLAVQFSQKIATGSYPEPVKSTLYPDDVLRDIGNFRTLFSTLGFLDILFIFVSLYFITVECEGGWVMNW
jgi:hypothetical protein